MAIKDIQAAIAAKKKGLGAKQPLMPSPMMGGDMMGGSMPPPPASPDMAGGMPPPSMGDMSGSSMPPTQGAQDPQAMIEEGKKKVLEGLAEIKQAQQMAGGQPPAIGGGGQ